MSTLCLWRLEITQGQNYYYTVIYNYKELILLKSRYMSNICCIILSISARLLRLHTVKIPETLEVVESVK